MKFKLLLTLVFLFALAASPAIAQEQGAKDTVDMIITVQPDESSAAFDVQLQLWVFNDGDTINGASMGFGWDNPTMQMTSATKESGSSGFLTTVLYDSDNIDSTNLRQRFQFVGIRLFTPGVTPSPTARHWATYNFSVAPDWVNSDVVHLDTFTYGSGQNYKFVSALGYDYFPYWKGPLEIVDANPSSPSMLAVSADTLFFTGVVNGDNPVMQTFTVSEASEGAIAYSVTESTGWITLGNASGTTPGVVQVNINTAGMMAGTFLAPLTVSSAEANNSPLTVYAKLTLTEQPALVVSEDTLYFTAVANGDNPPMQSFDVSESHGGVIPYNATVTMGDTWISLGNASGNTPATVEVNIDITGVAAGVYGGTIQIASDTASNTPQIVYVQLEVTQQPVLLISDDTLYFNAVANGVNPPMQTFNVAEAVEGAAIPYSAGVTIGDTWITLGNAAGMTPADVEVNININGVGEGTYYGAIEIVSDTAANSPQVVVVQLNVSAQAILLVPTDTLEFTAVENGDNPPMQTFLTAMSDDSEIPYEATIPSGNTWLFLGNAAGNTPANVEVNISILDLTPEIYFDSVQVTADAGNSPVFVYVRLTVAPQPMLMVSDTILSFSAVQGGANPAMQALTVSDVYGGAIPFTAAMTDIDVMTSLTNASGTTPADIQVNVNITGLIIGTYYDTIMVSSDTVSNSPLYVFVEITVEAPPCVVPTITDTIFNFTAVEGNPATSPLSRTFTVASSIASDNFDFTLDLAIDSANNSVYFSVNGGDPTLSPVHATTPAEITVTVDPIGLTEGQYLMPFMIVSEYSNICEYFTFLPFNVTIDIFPPPSADTLVIHNIGVSPGGQVVVPVTFSNSCNLKALEANLTWFSDYLHLDSVSYANSAVAYFDNHEANIDNDSRTVWIRSDAGTQDFFPHNSEQNWFDMYFSVSCDAEETVYPIFFNSEITDFAFFESDCGSGVETEAPITYDGSINVESKPFDFCGWVVEEGTGTSIPGATVVLFGNSMIDFNIDPDMVTTTSGIGSFLFENVETIPFSLWAYKEGYYPAKIEGLDLTDKGVMIVLTPIEQFAFQPHPWFVFYYCEYSTYYDGPLPVGSYVEARDASGLLVGQTLVTEAGAYGAMAVYQDDDETAEVEGMVPGETVHFFVNGEEATTYDNAVYPLATNMPPYQTINVCLEVGVVQVHTCDLFEGWNLISWDVNTDNGIEAVFGPYMDMIDVIIGFEQGGLIYDPELVRFSTLDYVDHYSGYWVKVKDGYNFTMEFTGSPVQNNTPISVTAGWNLVSYLPDEQLDIENGLSSLIDDDNLLVALGFEDSLRIFRPDWAFSTLLNMNSCLGYWVKVNHDAYLIYPGEVPPPAIIPENPRVQALASLAAKDVEPTNLWINLYSADLTLDGETVQAGATVTAHTASGELVGSYTLKTDGEFGFMPVYAAIDGYSLKPGDIFHLSIDGQKVQETLVWSNMGDRIEVTQLSTAAGNGSVLPEKYSLNQNYPNPFNPTTNISFTMAKAGQAKIEIFNLLGQLVAVPFDGQAQAGSNEIIWNGSNDSGEKVASGIYFYRLTADNFTETKKMMLLK